MVYPVNPVSRTRKITCEVLDNSLSATSTEFTQDYADVSIKESGVPFFLSALGENDSLQVPISEEAALYYVDLFKPLKGKTLPTKQQAAERLYSIPLSRVSQRLVSKEDPSGVQVNVIYVEGIVNGHKARLAEITVYPVGTDHTRKITCNPLHPSFAPGSREATHLYTEHIQEIPEVPSRYRKGVGTFVIESCPDSEDPSSLIPYAYAFTTDGKKVYKYVAANRQQCLELPQHMISSIFKNGYKGYVFYAHKFSRVDAFFMIGFAALCKREGRVVNILYNAPKEAVLSLEIGPKTRSTKDLRSQTILLRDSALIAPDSLEELAVSFKLALPAALPRSFVSLDTLSYVGAVPEAKHWDKDECPAPTESWNLSHKVARHVEAKVQVLYSIVASLDTKLSAGFGLRIWSAVSASGHAFNSYISRHYNKSVSP